jgi:hypothetical protein
MYRIAHQTLRLDGVITEFADIYAPLSQVWKTDGSSLLFNPRKSFKSDAVTNLRREIAAIL